MSRDSNLVADTTPRQFWVFVDPRDFVTKHNLGVVGSFCTTPPQGRLNDSGRKWTVTKNSQPDSLRAIVHLVAAPSIEQGCKRARVSKAAVYEWLKDEAFRQELKRQRDAVIERALDSLKANMAKATETLVKHLDSEHENISIRAAESIIEFTQKALEHEELEKRIAALVITAEWN